MTQLFEVTDTRTYVIAAADEAEAERLVKEVGGIFDSVRVVSARPRGAAQETAVGHPPQFLRPCSRCKKEVPCDYPFTGTVFYCSVECAD